MQIEIRASGGTACPVCNAGELIHANGKPLIGDLTRIFEREILRREIGVQRMLRDHINQADKDHADELSAEVSRTHFELTQQHNAALDEVKTRLEETKVDVPKWRAARRKRERIFAERIDSVVADLLDGTRYGS